jgi:hypothetical protein
VVDWWTSPYGALDFQEVEPVRLVAGKPYILLKKRYPLDEPWQHTGATAAHVLAILELGGPAVFAAGYFFPPEPYTLCGVSVAYSEDGIGLHALPPPSRTWHHFAWSTWSAPLNLDAVMVPHSSLRGCESCQDISFSRGALACWCYDGPVLFDTRSAGTILPAPSLYGAAVHPIADGFLTYTYDPLPESFEVLRATGAHEVVFRPESPHMARAAAVDRADADRLVWLEADGDPLQPWTNGSLWTAAYATREQDIARRRVTRLPTLTHRMPRFLVANAGLAVQLISPTKIYLTRISDGWSWSVDADPSDEILRPLWVDATEVWFAVDDAVNKKTWSIVRIERSALGPPTIPPKL